MNPLVCYNVPTTNPSLINTKRFSRQKNWDRPEQTETDRINSDPEEIKKKLENYIEVDNIDFVTINTHVRYFIFDTRVKEYRFRLGGLLAKKDNNFVVFSNGQLTWSVPKISEFEGKTYPTKFYRILNPTEMEQKRAEKMRIERDQQTMVTQHQLSELEKQKQEIERLKKVIYKMSEGQELNGENQSIVSNSKRTLGKNVVKNIRK